MKCPECESEAIVLLEKSADTERPGWRHHHGRCRQCGALVWWSSPIGAVDVVPKTGAHQCGFFSAPAT